MEHFRIAHLTSVHRTFDNRIFIKECLGLLEEGYQVTLIAPHHGNEVIQGVKIRAVPKPKNRLRRILFTTLRVLLEAVHEKADLYHFHDPELIPVGLLLRLMAKPVVYDVHDNYPKAALNRHYLPKFCRGFLESTIGFVEPLVSKCFNAVVLANPAEKERFNSVPVTTIQNYLKSDDLLLKRNTRYNARDSIVTYIGGISNARGAFEMIQAMGLLPERLNATLLLIGPFESPELERKLRALPEWKKVEYLGVQDRKVIRESLNRSRIGISLFHPISQYIGTQSTKLFEYMGAGIPTISSNFSFGLELTQRFQNGLSVDPYDTQALADSIQWLLENSEDAERMGEKGREAVQNNFTWESEIKSLTALYNTILKKTPSNDQT